MITPEQHAEIRRLYFGEHWKVGTIAAELGVHHDTVRAAIAQTSGLARIDPLLLSRSDPVCEHDSRSRSELRSRRQSEDRVRRRRDGRADAVFGAASAAGGSALWIA